VSKAPTSSAVRGSISRGSRIASLLPLTFYLISEKLV
jgi:hypothetical protein